MQVGPSATESALAEASPARPKRDWARGLHLWPWWLTVYVAALLLYGLTAARGVQWGDSGEFQMRLLNHELLHRLGLALVHPLHHWLCRLLEFGPWEPATAATLASVVTSAALIANVVVLLRIVHVRMSAALVAAGMLAVAHTVWLHGTVAEVYGLVGLTMSAELAALAAYARTGQGGWLILTALFNGLGVANHNLCGLLLPIHAGVAVAAMVRGRMSAGQFLLALAAWIAGASPYLFLIVQEAGRSGWDEALLSALLGGFARQVTNLEMHAGTLALGAAYIAYNFPTLGLPFALASLRNDRVPVLFYRVLAIDLVILLLFALRYDVPDQFVFFYPCYPLIAIFAGLGLERLLPDRWAGAAAPQSQTTRGWRGRQWLVLGALGVAATPAIYLMACHVARERGYLSGLAGSKPYRDGWATFMLPWQHTHRHAAALNHVLFREAGPDGVILCADALTEWAIDYVRTRVKAMNGVRLIMVPADGQAELEIQKSVRAAHAEGRRVVLSPRNRDKPPEVIAGSTWRRVGDVYVLESVP